MPASKLCKSILVADDNDDVRNTVVEALRYRGYYAVGACDGKEALELLDALPSPTLILLDLMMPVMNGWEFLEAQRRNAKFASHQVVVMSAVDRKHSMEDNSVFDSTDSLQKPLTLDSLWRKVKEFCGDPMVDQPSRTP